MAQINTSRLQKMFLTNSAFLSFLIGLSMFAVYVLSMSSQVTGFNDSDLMLALSSKYGLLPSPGYPLLTLLLGGSYQIMSTFLPLAHWGHMLNALISALSVSTIFTTIHFLYPYLVVNKSAKTQPYSELKRFLVAAIPSLSFAFSTLFWRISIFFERYSLSLLLISLIIYFFTRFLVDKKSLKPTVKYLLLTAFTIGIGITHQWIFLVILLTTILYLVVYVREKISLRSGILSLVALTVPLLLFLLLFLFNQNQVDYASRFPQSTPGLMSFISTNYFRDESLETNLIQRLDELQLRIVLQSVWEYLGMILRTSHLYLILFSIVGFFIFVKKNMKVLRSWLVVTATVLLTLIAIVVGWPGSSVQRAYVLPLLTYILPFTTIVAAIGLNNVINRFSHAGAVLTSPKKAIATIIALLVIPIALYTYLSYNPVRLTNKIVTQEHSSQVLSEVEDNALIFCFSRMSCFNLIYTKHESNASPTIIPFYYQTNAINLPDTLLDPFSYPTFPWNIFSMITWNVDERPVYLVDVFSEYFELLGVNYGFVNYIPQNHLVRLDREIPEELERKDHLLSEKLLSFETPAWDYFFKTIKTQFASRHMMDAVVYMKSDLRELAYRENNEASSLMHQLSEEDKLWVLRERQTIESLPTSDFFKLGSQVVEANYVLEQVAELEKSGRIRRASEIARGAVVLDPENIEARLKWAELLAATYASASAVTEYKNVLTLDPDNEIAPLRLETLKTAMEEKK